MSEKTPVCKLQEICAKRWEFPPIYVETTSCNVKEFTFFVSALGKVAEGSGLSKKEAKHNAAKILLQKLNKLTLNTRPTRAMTLKQQEQCPSKNNSLDSSLDAVQGNAVGTLMNLCVERYLPVEFQLIDSHGPAHAPEFIIECRVGDLVQTGRYSTKKGAKKIAAQLMLDLLPERVLPTDDLVPINVAFDNVQQKTKNIFKKYRQVKQSNQSLKIKFSDSHNYFLSLEEEKIVKAKMAIVRNCSKTKETVLSICSALGFDYDLRTVATEKGGMLLFSLVSDFDCLHLGPADQLFDDVLDYFKVMLNFSH